MTKEQIKAKIKAVNDAYDAGREFSDEHLKVNKEELTEERRRRSP